MIQKYKYSYLGNGTFCVYKEGESRKKYFISWRKKAKKHKCTCKSIKDCKHIKFVKLLLKTDFFDSDVGLEEKRIINPLNRKKLNKFELDMYLGGIE